MCGLSPVSILYQMNIKRQAVKILFTIAIICAFPSIAFADTYSYSFSGGGTETYGYPTWIAYSYWNEAVTVVPTYIAVDLEQSPNIKTTVDGLTPNITVNYPWYQPCYTHTLTEAELFGHKKQS